MTRRIPGTGALRAAAAALGLALAVTGCQVDVPGTPAAAPVTAASDSVGFAPYIDISVRFPDLVGVAERSGVRHVVLAFALADGGACTPSWGGTQPVEYPALREQVDAFRAVGGDVTVATGGATGRYLEQVCGSPAELVGAYETLLDAFETNRLDVDIEAPVDNDLVVEALVALQRSRGTAISLTLPIDLAGLPPVALELVQKAAGAGLQFTLNGMDMNFVTGGDWGQAMIDAAQATLDQLRRVYPDGSEAAQNRTLGLTIMIGRNDVGTVTTIENARTVLEFAQSRKIGFLGIWSLARDFGTCPGRVRASPECSGVEQEDLEFSTLLNGFAAT